MADEKEKAPDSTKGPDIEKLKELEANLAKELDQRVRLTEPTDPRLEGTVEVNPSMEEALKRAQAQAQVKILASDERAVVAMTAQGGQGASAPQATSQQNPQSGAAPGMMSGAGPVGAEAKPFGKNADDISLSEVDELLNQFDENFQKNLDEIGKEVKAIEAPANLESLPIGNDYLKNDNKDVAAIEAEEPPPVDKSEPDALPGRFWPALVHLLKSMVATPFRIAVGLTDPLKQIRSQPPRETLNLLRFAVALPLQNLFVEIKSFWLLLKSYPRRTYYLLLAIAVISAAVLWLSVDIATHFGPDREKDPFLRSFNEVADSVQVIPENSEGEDIESPLRHPEYIVHIQRLVANLKPENPSVAPMVAAEFYIEASNQDCAIEIHDREPEVRDIIERVLEGTTFADLDSKEGKTRLKIRMRMAINRILNKGNVKGVFFKGLNYHE